ncbi:neuromedin Bb [Electrophorus electricus]|uniref:Neuromedin Bb n=1 Tax=Electrophorus electricus TaxID=8005 RepID=A0A4W4G9N3_ELEEL|nr:neuromedin Bb [Electrophorus electricus]
MSSFTLHNFTQFGFFAYLVLFSYISVTFSVSLDLTELRNKVAKIKVNPRGNLWATGHFMGKKSVVDSAFSPPEDDAMSAYEVALNPQKVEPDDLYQEVLKIALQARLDSQESRAKIPETALLMKILESYIQGNRK